MNILSITAIITTHRRPELLIRALKSLGAERRKPDEILVIHDGEDPSLDALLRGCGVPCRLLQRPLFSVFKARNLGLMEAAGDWVIYLDDDDIVYEDRLAKLESAALRSKAAFIFGSTLKVTPQTRFPVPAHHPVEEGPSSFVDILRCMPHTNSILFSKRELMECGGFMEASSYFSDWCAMLQMVDRAGAWRIPAVLSEFEAISAGMTHQVAKGNGMKAKVLEAFDHLQLQSPQNRRWLREVRRTVEAVEAFSSYDDYVELACKALAGNPAPLDLGNRRSVDPAQILFA